MKKSFLPAAALVALGISSIAGATTYTVPGSFSTIQAAITAAAANDVIVVANGTYNTKIDFLGKQITVKSLNGPTFTTINASGQSSSVVTCKTGETNLTILDGFKLTGGTGTNFGGRFRGGGVYCNMATPLIKNCIITLNSADDGGGVYNFVADAKYINCVIDDNGAQNGGGVYNDLSNPAVFNCTITKNSATVGGGFYGSQSTPRLISCIVWSNSGDSFGGPGNKIVSNSDVQGGVAGSGNIDQNPLFQNRSNDFRLMSGSPCIDSGDSSAIANTVFKDIIGNQRGVDDPTKPDAAAGIPVFGLVVDMGAYEVQVFCASGSCPTDITHNGKTDVDDLLAVINGWGNCP